MKRGCGPRSLADPTDLVRPLFLKLDPETAHRAAIRALSFGIDPRRTPKDDPTLRLTLFGRQVSNPLGVAPGFDKNGEAVRALLAAGFGHVEVGTVTPQPQTGNPRPRVFRLPEDSAVINRLGFNNDGADRVVGRLSALRARRPAGSLLGVNIGANRDSADRFADYAVGVKRFAALCDYLAINISSPNTPGLRDLQAEEALKALLAAVREVRSASGAPNVPILVKIAPDLDLTALDRIAEAALAAKVDGLIVSNTTIARPADLMGRHRGETGGLSGAPLFSASTRLLAHAHQRVGSNMVLVGVGGVDGPRTALAKVLAGATLVQLYTGLIYGGFGLVDAILDGLANAARRAGGSLDALKGTAAEDIAEGRLDPREISL